MSPELEMLVERVAREINALQAATFFKASSEELAFAVIRAVAEATRDATGDMARAALARPQPDPDPWMYPAIWRAMHAASPLGEALRDE